MQKEIERKIQANTYVALKILREEEKLKKKKEIVKKKAKKDTKKTCQLAAWPFQKNLPNGIQKSYK